VSGKSAKQKRKDDIRRPVTPLPGVPGASSMPKSFPAGSLRGIVTSEKLTVSHSSAPLPDPDTLQKYQGMIPDAPERLLAIVEKEQLHRHTQEKLMADAFIADTAKARNADLRGDIIALIVFLTCMGVGCFLLINGYSEWIAASLMGAPLITAIGSFLFRRRYRNQSHLASQENPAAPK
jgi:uncharacterized membrane protein